MADAALPASDAITNVEKITKNLSTARDGIGKILSTDPSSALVCYASHTYIPNVLIIMCPDDYSTVPRRSIWRGFRRTSLQAGRKIYRKGAADALRSLLRGKHAPAQAAMIKSLKRLQTSRVHTDLLDVLDAQKDSIRPTPFAGTLTSLLRNDKNAAKALNFAILDLAPTCKDSLSKELDAQQKRLDEVFRAYDEA